MYENTLNYRHFVLKINDKAKFVKGNSTITTTQELDFIESKAKIEEIS